MLDLNLAGVLLAGLTALLGYLQGRSAERHGELGVRLSAAEFAGGYFRDLRAWTSECIDVLSEAAYRAPGRADSGHLSAVEICRLRWRLSALIDRGRFLIPNQEHDSVGLHKPVAYRGRRHAALDSLVAAEQVLSPAGLARSGVTSQRSALIELRREFVSELQELLDPRAQNREVALLLKSAAGFTDGPSAFEKLAAGTSQDFDAAHDAT